jgi:hypothetical protein
MRNKARVRDLFVCTRLMAAALVLPIVQTADGALTDRGQPISAGASPTAGDALFVLNDAVALQSCDLCVCETNGSGAIMGGDALLTLSVAVGAGPALACEPCQDEARGSKRSCRSISTTADKMVFVNQQLDARAGGVGSIRKAPPQPQF